MGGKMNLNPLKKDDNTDALVKALEDANNVGTDTAAPAIQPTPDPAVAVDSATIAADPQITGDPVAAPVDAPVAPASDATTAAVADTVSAPVDTVAPSVSTEPVLTLDSSADLPAGISSDADAHLASEDTGDNGELDDVKKDALEQLRPLIEKLDLEPADKFDKYLMMLRASDDAALIKPAFDAAQGITGEKEKAQALLDIINEINYITANNQPQA